MKAEHINKTNISFHEKLVIRKPLFDYPHELSEKFIGSFFSEPGFAEAIYIASPSLYQCTLDGFTMGNLPMNQREKLIHSLLKYNLRMAIRPTPFGLFSATGIVSAHTVGFSREVFRTTNISPVIIKELICRIQQIEPVISQVKYFLNNTIYPVGNEWRYIEDVWTGSKIEYRVSSVDDNKIFRNILQWAKKGIHIIDLKQKIMNSAIYTDIEIEEYITALISNKVLVSELEMVPVHLPSVAVYLKQFQDSGLSGIKEVEMYFGLIKKIMEACWEFDSKSENTIDSYERLRDNITVHKFKFAENRFFQINSFLNDTENKTPQMLDEISRSLQFLSRLSPVMPNQPLEKFISQYQKKYDNQTMPLLEVLDQETGINYLSFPDSDEEEFSLPWQNDFGKTNDVTINLSPIQQYILDQSIQLLIQRERELYITDEQMQGFFNEESKLPPSFSLIYKQYSSHNTVILESIGDCSAKNILARFTLDNKYFELLAKDIARHEEQANPDVAFVDIDHLPDIEHANITLHRTFHQFQIPILAPCCSKSVHTIPLQDINISIVNNQIVLHSKLLNRQIIPRFSNAYNYSLSKIPVFRFLCDLQHQGIQTNLNLNLSPLLTLTGFIPTIRYNNTILHAATWQLKKHQLEALLTQNKPQQWQTFLQQHNLPNIFALKEGDNELFIDARNPVLQKLFLHSIRNKETIRLKELYVNEDDPSTFAQTEYVLSVLNHQPVYAAVNKKPLNQKKVQESFAPGTSWFYCKIYCSSATANEVLTTIIHPLVTKLTKEKKIQKWFFVRYKDPRSHLRLRLLLNNDYELNSVLQQLHQRCKKHLRSKRIQAIQMDTYKRELQRYGNTFIIQAESIFHVQSQCVMEYLQQDISTSIPSWLFALAMIDSHLIALNYSLQQRLTYVTRLRDAFLLEFNVTEEQKHALNKKYTAFKGLLFHHLDQPSGPLKAQCIQFTKRLSCLVQEIKSKHRSKQQYEKNMAQWMSSYLHMFINKIMPSQQREKEMMIYHFLAKFYTTQTYLQKAR